MPSKDMKRVASNEGSGMPSKKRNNTNPSSKKPSVNSKNAVVVPLSPEGILQSSWKFLEFAQFCTMFDRHLDLPIVDFDIIEAMLLSYEPQQQAEQESQRETPILSERSSRNSSVTTTMSVVNYNSKFEELVKSLFRSLSDDRTLPNNFDVNENLMQIRNSATTSYDKTEISKPQTTSFYDLKLDEKIEVLHILMESVTETPSSGIGELSKNGHEDFKRYGPIGVDNDGRSYWFFGVDRLYREAPFYRVKQQLPSSADRQDTYELLCRNVDDWRSFVKELSSKRKNAKRYPPELAENLKAIGEMAVQTFEEREKTRQRKEEKLQRAALKAKALEQIPRKRSSRLEQKKQEHDELVKLEEVMESIEDIEAVRRFEALEQKRQERIVRENRIKEKENILREEFQKRMTSYLQNVVSNDRNQAAEQCIVPLSKASNTLERVAKMRMWLSFLKPDESVKVYWRDTGVTTIHAISNIIFSSASEKTDIRSPILKNTVRVFIASLKGHPTADSLQEIKPRTSTEVADNNIGLEDVYSKLVLDEYDTDNGFEQLGHDIKLIFETALDLAQHAADKKIEEFVTFFRELTFNTFAEVAPSQPAAVEPVVSDRFGEYPMPSAAQ